jgi:hypothetical protein
MPHYATIEQSEPSPAIELVSLLPRSIGSKPCYGESHTYPVPDAAPAQSPTIANRIVHTSASRYQ